MPSPRSLILLSVLTLVISIAANVISMLGPPDSGGEGRDSYGVRGDGFRAIHDLLGELGISVTREFRPPDMERPGPTIALLAPDSLITGTEPAYLRSLVPWIRNGGRVLVAPRILSSFEEQMRQEQMAYSEVPLPEIWETLELSGLQIDSDVPDSWRDDRHEQQLIEEVLESWVHRPYVSRIVKIETTGSLSETLGSIKQLALPGDQHAHIVIGDKEPIGTLLTVTGRGEERILAAEFQVGQGRLIVVANAAIISNRFLGQAQNSILAARLLSPDGNAIVFDEFFHGLGVRGNSFYLLTRPGYAALAIGLLLFVCLASWRQAVLLGPPLADDEHPRRDVREYVEAMGDFFARGRKSRPFLIERLRDGVLRELSVAHALPPETKDVMLVVTTVGRTNPRRSERIQNTFHFVDTSLDSRRNWTESQTLDAMRRLTACL